MVEYEKGIIKVTFFPNVQRWRVDDLCRTVHGKVSGSREANTFVVSLPEGKEDEAARRLRVSPHVLYAERVAISQPS